MGSVANVPRASKPKRDNRKRNLTSNDTLANIQVPRYEYNALPFCSKRPRIECNVRANPSTSNIDNNNNSDSMVIEDVSQASISNSRENLIEEYSSSEERTPEKRSPNNTKHLLSGNESIFLNINTQVVAGQNGAHPIQRATTSSAQSPNPAPAAHPPVQPERNQATANTMATIAGSASTSGPAAAPADLARPLRSMEPLYRSPHISADTRCEYLYHIDMANISACMTTRRDGDGILVEHLEIEASLRYQCNGQTRIKIKNDGLQKLLKLSDAEWKSVGSIMSVIRRFEYANRFADASNESIFHQALYYLFKTTSPFSDQCIEYSDRDLDVVRIVPEERIMRCEEEHEDMTDCFSDYVLDRMEQFVAQMNAP